MKKNLIIYRIINYLSVIFCGISVIEGLDGISFIKSNNVDNGTKPKSQKPDKEYVKLKKNLSKMGLPCKNLQPVGNTESYKELNDKISDGNVANNVKQLFTKISNPDEQKALFEFLLKHPGFIDYLGTQNDIILDAFKGLKELEDDKKNPELANMYDEILKNKDLVQMLLKMDKNLVRKIARIIQIYCQVDEKERKPIESALECFLKTCIYQMAPLLYIKLYKDNRKDFGDIFKDRIRPYFSTYINNLSMLSKTITDDSKNKESIEKFKKDVNDSLKKLKNEFREQSKEYGTDKLSEGLGRKINGCKVSCKEGKVPLR